MAYKNITRRKTTSIGQKQAKTCIKRSNSIIKTVITVKKHIKPTIEMKETILMKHMNGRNKTVKNCQSNVKPNNEQKETKNISTNNSIEKEILNYDPLAYLFPSFEDKKRKFYKLCNEYDVDERIKRCKGNDYLGFNECKRVVNQDIGAGQRDFVILNENKYTKNDIKIGTDSIDEDNMLITDRKKIFKMNIKVYGIENVHVLPKDANIFRLFQIAETARISRESKSGNLCR